MSTNSDIGAKVNSKLSAKAPLGYIEIRVFSHATEDEDRVRQAILNTLPEEIGSNLALQKTGLKGHHGNPIILLETKLVDKSALSKALAQIGSCLTVLDKELLNNNLSFHVEKSNLYLRFDKQYAFMGQLRLSSNDPIHFKFHFKNKTVDQIASICREKGLLP